jgi:hypothetical protein
MVPLLFPMQAPTRDSSDTFSAANLLLCCMSEPNSSALGAFTSASGSNRCSPLFLMTGLRSDFKTPNSGIGNAHLFFTRCKASTRPPLLHPHGLSSAHLYKSDFPARTSLVGSSDDESTSTRLVLLCVCCLFVRICPYANLSTGRPVPHYNVAP